MEPRKMMEDPVSELASESLKLQTLARLVSEAADQEEKDHWVHVGHMFGDFADRITACIHAIIEQDDKLRAEAAEKARVAGAAGG